MSSNRKIRYGDYLSSLRYRQRTVSYSDITRAGRPKRMHLRGVDIYRLLTPYFGSRFRDQAYAVLPLASFLLLFIFFALRAEVDGPLTVAIGFATVMAGLMLFMEGVKYGLMPFSENIGYKLPARSRLMTILTVAFLLGVAATLAEPAIGALKTAGSLTRVQDAPHLHALLNEKSHLLVASVGVGVGLAVALGMMRFFYEWSMRKILFFSVPPCLGLSAFCASQPELVPILGLAWDCGAITTGPVTVPLVLAMGIGVSAAAGREDNPLSGFGIVTLASLFPPMTVMITGIAIAGELPDLSAPLIQQVNLRPPGVDAIPVDVLNALQAILPLVAFLWLIQRLLLREGLSQPKVIGYGIAAAVFGMALFTVGLDFGLASLGKQAGNLIASAFSAHSAVPGSPLYPYWIGLLLTLGFAMLLGYGATIAEPALNAMGITVQNLTDGAFSKRNLIQAVAFGVGIGTAAGVAKIIFDLPLVWMLLPCYVLALALTVISKEEIVCLAWDSAGVTTGPVTVPLVLAMGLGLGQALGAKEGFGILALASVGPIISVLTVGLWVRISAARLHQRKLEGLT